MTRNLAWYAKNASRSYPIDEAASLLSDDGELLPGDILVDCHLVFPQSLARYAFLGGVTVSEHAVSIVILGSNVPARQAGCDSEEASDEAFTPLAAVTLAKSALVVGRNYPVQALGDGVGGWVVFGDGATNKRGADPNYFHGRFSSVSQTMLTPRAARSYTTMPVTSVGRYLEAASLDGLVRLDGGGDLEIVREEQWLDGRFREVIVFRLKNAVPIGEGRNVFEVYNGPCEKRPESGTCDGEPIEQINSTTPDCCGRLTINFLGCAVITPTSDGHGVVIDCGIGLLDVCLGPDQLPDRYGRLPNEKDPECDDA